MLFVMFACSYNIEIRLKVSINIGSNLVAINLGFNITRHLFTSKMCTAFDFITSEFQKKSMVIDGNLSIYVEEKVIKKIQIGCLQYPKLYYSSIFL